MINENELWAKTKDALQKSEDPTVFNQIFEPINNVYKFVSGSIYLIVDNTLTKYRVEKFYLEKMNNILADFAAEKVNFKLITKDEVAQEQERVATIQQQPVQNNTFRRNPLRKEYTFDQFVTGEANREAFTFSVKIANNPNVTINPFYIFGDVGLGKTHLMNAIGHEMLKNNPNLNVIYITAQQFIEDFFKAKNRNQHNIDISEAFDDFYRSADVLLVDDIQFLESKQGSQDEFFKIFEILFSANKQIVVTSDRPANELNIMARLKSRFSWGIQTNLTKPNLNLRKEIAKNKLKDLISDVNQVNDEIIEYIAENFDQNVRELEGALRRFVSYCVSFNYDFTLENAILSLEPIISKEKSKDSNANVKKIEQIKQVIASYFNLNVNDLSSETRKKEIVYARDVTCYILKTKYNLTMTTIGDYLGHRDHATIAHSLNKMTDLVKNDQLIKEDIDNVTANLDKLYTE